VLSTWDRLFGSFRSRRCPETVSLGLDGFPEQAIDSLPGMMLAPFGELRTANGERPHESLLEPDGVRRRRRSGPSPRGVDVDEALTLREGVGGELG
jgi:hypothetical protein